LTGKNPFFWIPVSLIMKNRFILSLGLVVLTVSGCATPPPKNSDDLCAIFKEKPRWYREAKESYRRWGVPIPILMAIIYQESSFRARARPPRKRYLGFIPGPRPSNAYGYAQALKETWEMYVKSTGRKGADRDDFADAVDFIGWYGDVSHRRCGIPKRDAYRLYLAYHEGHGGFNKNSYAGKSWLLGIAEQVKERASIYSRQLARCRGKLEKDSKKKRFLFF